MRVLKNGIVSDPVEQVVLKRDLIDVAGPNSAPFEAESGRQALDGLAGTDFFNTLIRGGC